MNARILIADDEELERRALSLILSSIDSYSLTLVDAANGRQAVEEVRKSPTDIALLDVRMPGMDGMAAAREIRAFSPQTRIVFVTAFDSFDYAREALRLGVDEYLLKPADRETVKTTVERLLERLFAERAETEARRRTGEEHERALGLLERELRAAMERNALVGDRFGAFLKLRGIRDGDRFVAVAKPLPDGNRDDQAIKRAHARQLAAVAENALRANGWFGVAVADGSEIRIIAAAEAKIPLNRSVLLEVMTETVREVLGQHIIVGAAPVFPADGPELFAPAQDAAALATAANPIIVLAPLSAENPVDKTLRTETGTTIVEKAVEYIKSHLAEDLSLTDVAARVACSPFHLSRLFRLHSGNTFIHSIAKLRIDSAKALLRTGKYNVKEAAAIVGFHDQAYFARIFKRVAGCQPAEFKADPFAR